MSAPLRSTFPDARFRGWLTGPAWGLTRNSALAEDLVQDTLIRLLVQWDSLERLPEDVQRARALRTMRWIRLSDLRLRHRAERREALWMDLRPRRAEGPVEAVIVRSWLGLLAPGERETVEYRLSGYTLAEIAAMTGVSLRTVHLRLKRSRSRWD